MLNRQPAIRVLIPAPRTSLFLLHEDIAINHFADLGNMLRPYLGVVS